MREAPGKAAAIAGVIGHPVAHSVSPEIFEFLARKTGVPLVYRRLDILPADLGRSARFFRDFPLFTGWNVTIPHKQRIARDCAKLSEEARLIGAVNVVHFLQGELHGHNTDVLGIEQTLREQGLRMRGRSAIVLGAGGAALAVGFALGRAGAAAVTIANRTPARARAAARRLQAQFPETRFLASAVADAGRIPGSIALYVNATPLGMQGFPRKSAFPLALQPEALAFDLVYRPTKTPFLLAAKARGLKTVGGLDMLIWQALATHRIWFGPIRNEKRMKAALKSHLMEKFHL